MSPTTIAAPLALPTPASSAETIYVTDAYTIAAGDSLTLHGSPGFKLVVRNSADVSLDIDGTLTMRGGPARDKLIGIITTDAVNGSATVTIGAGGAMSVVSKGLGLTEGAAISADNSLFDNKGQLTVAGQAGGLTSGVILTGSGDVLLNEGQIHVTGSGDDVFGVFASAGPSSAGPVMTNIGLIEAENPGGVVVAFGSYSVNGSVDNQGLVISRGLQASGMAATAGVTMSNSGTVRAYGEGAGAMATGVALGNSGGLTNSGVISASGPGAAYGVIVNSLGVLDNSGTITGGTAGVMLQAGSLDTVINRHLIRGDYAIVAQDVLQSATHTVDSISNLGRLAGDVALGGGDDSLSNSGTIDGDVSLGDGDDNFQSSRGTLHGVVTGGLGGDQITGGADGDALWGDEQDDSAGGGDDLLRGLGGDDSLVGGQGRDTLMGGAGADSLTGGAGVDLFKFTTVSDSTASAHDLIADLANADRIDLHAIDADTATGGDQAFHLVGSFSGAAGELVVTYDVGTGITTISGDVDGDGAADLVITADGDHSGFSNFVL